MAELLTMNCNMNNDLVVASPGSGTSTPPLAGLTENEMMELSYPRQEAASHNTPGNAQSPIAEMMMESTPNDMNEGASLTPSSRKHRRKNTSKLHNFLMKTLSMSPSQLKGTMSNTLDSPGATAPVSPVDSPAPASTSTPYSVPSPSTMPTLPSLDFKITSSENEPSHYQVEFPKKSDVVVCAKLCQFMNGYKAIAKEYPFDLIKGGPLSSLNVELLDLNSPNEIDTGTHRSILSKLKECGVHDLIIDGFIAQRYEGDNFEIIVVSSEQLRQTIVCGNVVSDEQLVKKIKHGASTTAKLGESGKVHATLRDVFVDSGLEESLFHQLGLLERPFFDVVFTGHSAGAAMATLAAARYADMKPQLRITANVLGSPRIGDDGWRRFVHSLPNLRIFRLENGQDFALALPSGKEWTPVGHCIQISSDFKACRFDKAVAPRAKLMWSPMEISAAKANHKIDAYVDNLGEKNKSQWVTDFSCLKGKGVLSLIHI